MILYIIWPDTISNYELRRWTGPELIALHAQVQRKKCRWIGRVLGTPLTAALRKVALRWSLDVQWPQKTGT